MNDRAIPEAAPPEEIRPDDESHTDPSDFSAVGGPDTESAYGRTRALDGEYPFNAQGGTYDRDDPSHLERGGIQNEHHVVKRP